jgi:hypothetical protein
MVVYLLFGAAADNLLNGMLVRPGPIPEAIPLRRLFEK